MDGKGKPCILCGTLLASCKQQPNCLDYGKLKLHRSYQSQFIEFFSSIMTLILSSFPNMFHDNIKDSRMTHHSDSICLSDVFVVSLCKFRV